jgi:hypothetical protein
MTQPARQWGQGGLTRAARFDTLGLTWLYEASLMERGGVMEGNIGRQWFLPIT